MPLKNDNLDIDVPDTSILEDLVISLAAGRHMLVTGENWIHAMDMIQKHILRRSRFKLGRELVRFDLNDHVEDINALFTSISNKTGKIFLLSHVEQSESFQRRLHGLLTERWYGKDDNSMILVIIFGEDTTKLIRVLQDDIWIHEELAYSRIGSLKPISDRYIINLRKKADQVVMVREIITYIYDIVIFARTDRFVIGGIPTYTLKDFHLFLKVYSAMYDHPYIIPEMVKMVAYKLLTQRIRLLENPAEEPSVQYGSDIDLVRQVQKKVDAHTIIETIMAKIQPPV